MILEEAYEAIRDLLRTYVVDPTSRGAHWIYPDYPREDTAMPRISVYNTGLDRTEIGVGDQGSRFTARFEIGIWTNSRVSVTIGVGDAADTKKGSELREYIGDLVVATVRDKRGYLKTTYGFLDAIISANSTLPYDPNTDLYRKFYTLEVTWDTLRT